MLVLGTIVVKIVAGALAVIIARNLPVAEFGAFSFAVAYANLVAIFADLGVGTVTTRELVQSSREEEGAILGSSMVVKSAVALLCIIGSIFGSFLYTPDLRLAAIVSVMSVAAVVPATMSQALTSRLHVIGPTILQLAGGVLTVGGTVALLALGGGVVALLALQTVASVAAGVAVAIYALRRGVARPTVDRATMKRLIRGAMPLAVSTVSVVIYRRIDQPILARLAAATEVARYGAAVRVVDALNMVPMAVAAISLPTLAHLRASAQKEKADLMAAFGFRLLALVILPFAAVGTVLGSQLMSALFGASYGSFGLVLTLLLWAHYFGFIGLFAQQIVIARDVTRPMAILYFLSAVLNITLNIVLIPRHGALGSAWASLAAYAMPFIAATFIPSVRDIFRSAFVASARPALAAALIVAILQILPSRGVAAFALAPFIVVAAVLATRSTTLDELRRMLRAFGHRGGRLEPAPTGGDSDP